MSWVSLISKNCNQVHFVRMHDLDLNRKEEKALQNQGLGFHFFDCDDGAQIEVSSYEMPDSFWKDVKVIFSKDGKQAILRTPLTKFLVKFEEKDEENKLKVIKIISAQNKNVSVFQNGESDFHLVERKNDNKTIEILSVDRNMHGKGFVGRTVNIDGIIDINEAIELVRKDRKVLRLSAIRASRELLNWEIEQGTNIGAKSPKSSTLSMAGAVYLR